MTCDQPVHLDFAHRVRFTRGAFSLANTVLSDLLKVAPDKPQPKLFVVADQGIVDALPSLQNDIESYFVHHADQLPALVGFRALPGGEVIKNDLSLLESLLGDLNRLGIDRQSYVLVLGGGALLDAVGFAAAITHRGVRLLRMPTSTLAQCDSGVGVKNGVNMFGKKNFIGSFAVPFAVVNDLSMLDTLSDRDWRCGLAEAVKVALLKDAAFYDAIRELTPGLLQRDAEAGDSVWQRSAELHLQHICQPRDRGGGGDPFELESARPLDLGHWAGHQLEALSDYDIRHGEAVALGLALDIHYAGRIGLIAPAVANDIHQTLQGLGFELSHPTLNHPSLLDGLVAFREHLGGRLTVTLLRDIGEPVEVHDIDRAVMQSCVDDLLSRHASSPSACG